MSETALNPEKQAEIDAAQKSAAEKRAARVKVLKSYAGKSFVKKGNPKGEVTKVLDYAGVHTRDGLQFDCFLAEKPGCRWTPPATKFLEEHEEISIIKTETQEVI